MSPENLRSHTQLLSSSDVTSTAVHPLLVADGLHILNPQVYKAVANQDGKIFSILVQEQLDAGAEALAVNLGPGREMGRLTPWVVDTIREFTELPLFFSANIVDHQELLQTYGKNITVNAVTANSEELEQTLKVAKKYGCSVVVLLVKSGQLTSGIEDKIHLAVEVLDKAVLTGFPLAKLYLDPVLACRPDPVAWNVSRGVPDVESAVETIKLIRQLDSEVKAIVALGNSSVAIAKDRRGVFHANILSLFAQAGVNAVLCNCLDWKMMRTADAVSRSTFIFHGQEAGEDSSIRAI